MQKKCKENDNIEDYKLTLNKEDIIKAYEYQQKVGYTFNNEREMTESAFNNRFNFLLLTYSLFLNAYFYTNTKIDKLTILIIGLLIISLLFIVCYRVHIRLQIIIEILKKLDVKDACTITWNQYQGKRLLKIFHANSLVGVATPTIMILSFIVGIIYNLIFK